MNAEIILITIKILILLNIKNLDKFKTIITFSNFQSNTNNTVPNNYILYMNSNNKTHAKRSSNEDLSKSFYDENNINISNDSTTNNTSENLKKTFSKNNENLNIPIFNENTTNNNAVKSNISTRNTHISEGNIIYQEYIINNKHYPIDLEDVKTKTIEEITEKINNNEIKPKSEALGQYGKYNDDYYAPEYERITNLKTRVNSARKLGTTAINKVDEALGGGDGPGNNPRGNFEGQPEPSSVFLKFLKWIRSLIIRSLESIVTFLCGTYRTIMIANWNFGVPVTLVFMVGGIYIGIHILNRIRNIRSITVFNTGILGYLYTNLPHFLGNMLFQQTMNPGEIPVGLQRYLLNIIRNTMQPQRLSRTIAFLRNLIRRLYR